MEIGKVYKNNVDPNLMRVVIYTNGSHVITRDVIQDNGQAKEFTIGEQDYVVMNSDKAAWELVEGLELKGDVNSIMLPFYS